jgi:hypothetical protein
MKAAGKKLMRGPAALCWAFSFFICFQVGLNVVLDGWRAGSCDPEFTAKLARLRACQAKNPARPLALFLGSSRTLFGLRPDLLPSLPTTKREKPLVFNYGLTGFAPPLCQLVCLRRLLAAGVRPEWLFIEILPADLYAEQPVQDNAFLLRRWSRRDLSLLSHYFPRFMGTACRWAQLRLVPSYSFRLGFMGSIAPTWVPASILCNTVLFNQDDRGWLVRSDAGLPENKAEKIEQARKGSTSLSNLTIAPVPDRALRQMLSDCRSAGIHAVLYLMPEGEVYRSWYSTKSRGRLNSYLARLQEEFQVTVLDARAWVAEDDFYDSHHLTVRGAAVFTRRLGRDVLPTILTDQ